MLKATNLSKSYCSRRGNEVVAVAPIDLHVQRGEYVAVVGPSGSGKTTLQLMLGAMLPPTTGRVELDGISLYEQSAKERARLRRSRIGFVFQSFHLLPYFTARENIQVPLWLCGADPATHRTTADRLLARFELEDRADHRPDELSAGQQQRIALARVLAIEPDVILADEPTGNLDPATASDVASFLRASADDGTTLVVVTHDPEVAQLADRTIHLREGSLRSR